jgi:hypothetical protein
VRPELLGSSGFQSRHRGRLARSTYASQSQPEERGITESNAVDARSRPRSVRLCQCLGPWLNGLAVAGENDGEAGAPRRATVPRRAQSRPALTAPSLP